MSASCVFRDEGKLSPEYLPQRTPHRDGERRELFEIYRPMLKDEGLAPIAFLVGPVGSGKTMMVRMLGKEMEEKGVLHGCTIKPVSVNCRTDRTPTAVMNRVVEALGARFPKRGLEAQETLRFVLDMLARTRGRLLLILDEADSLVSAGDRSLLYSLARLREIHGSSRVALLMLSKSTRFLLALDASTRSSLQKTTLALSGYTVDQLVDIIASRAEESMQPGAMGVDVARFIANLSQGGDARYCVELLLRSGSASERRGACSVAVSDVLEARNSLPPGVDLQELQYLTEHERLVLTAAANLLRGSRAFISTGELEAEYRGLCATSSVKHCGHTTFWMTLQKLKAKDFLGMERSGRGRRGRTTLIMLRIRAADAMRGLDKAAWSRA